MDTKKRTTVESSSGHVWLQSERELMETIKVALSAAAPLEPNHDWIKACARLDYTFE